PQIRPAFSYEFMERSDGYTGLVKRYGLDFDPIKVKRMEHALVYKALNENAVDIIEVYSTDANIKRFDLKVLEDDLDYFPSFQAVWVARTEFTIAHPKAWKSLLAYQGRINETEMREMNTAADIDKHSFEQIASDFLGTQTSHKEDISSQILQRT